MFIRVFNCSLAACLAVVVTPSSLAAQLMPGAVWGETTVEVVEPGIYNEIPHIDPTDRERVPAQTRMIHISDLPEAMQYEQVLQLNQQVASATVEVRVVFRPHPLISPNVIEVEGAATWVDRGEGTEPVLLTASYLVNGAESVEIVTPHGTMSADVTFDARYGLAVLTPVETITPETTLTLSQASAETSSEAFGPRQGSFGSVLGAAEGGHGYYQLNNTGVALGYPVIDREGNLLGIGSHYFPPDPAFSLSIPADSVDEYLGTLIEE